MQAGIDAYPIMARATTSRPTTQIVAGSLHRPVRTADIPDDEFQFFS